MEVLTLMAVDEKFTMPSRKKSREQRLTDRLLRGASNGALTDAKAIIQEGAQVVCCDSKGATPLHLACRSGHLDMSEMLIEQGAPVNALAKSNYAPIHMAAKEGHSHMIEPLYRSGAVLNIETKFERRTALHIAAAAGWVPVVQVLLDLKVETNKPDIYGSTPLHLAAVAGHTEVVRMLLDYSADVSATNRDGWTALHFAAQNGHTDVTVALLEGHAQIDAQTKFGRTPLHCACSHGKLSTVEAILSRGANIMIKDAHGKTVAECCKDERVLQIIQIFAQDQTVNFSQSMNCISWYLPENKLMSMQSVIIPTEPKQGLRRKVSRMSQSVPDFKSVGELDGTDREDETAHLSPEEREFFKIKRVEPVTKVYKKVQFTLKTLFNVLELRHHTMEKHVTAAIKSRSVAASMENVKEIHAELQSLKQNMDDFKIEIPSKLQNLIRTLHELVETLESLPSDAANGSSTGQGSSPSGPRRKQAVTVTGPPPSLNDLARQLGDDSSDPAPEQGSRSNSDQYDINTLGEHFGTDPIPFHMMARRQISMPFEEDAAEVAQHIRVFHHVSAIVARKKGTWKKLHSNLHSSVPDPITQATARGIEANYTSDSDRAFESLWGWFWQRQSASVNPLITIIESLEQIGINPKHVDAIKALASADHDNSTVMSGDPSDSDTLSAGDSDDGYMDGIRVPEEDGEETEDREAPDPNNTSAEPSTSERENGTLSHIQKIKAQRKISSTPLHDYKNPSRILDPECIRGDIQSESSQDSLKSDVNHNDKGPSSSSSSYTDHVDLSNVEVEEDDVFSGLNKIEEENEEEGEVERLNTGLENDTSSEKSDDSTETRKTRRLGFAGFPFVNSILSPNNSNNTEVDLQHDRAKGLPVGSAARDEARMSLKRLSDRDRDSTSSTITNENNQSRITNSEESDQNRFPTSISSNATCRSWSNSSDSYSPDTTGPSENSSSSIPQVFIQKPSIAETNVSTIRNKYSTSSDNGLSNKNFLRTPRVNVDLSSGSSSDGDPDERSGIQNKDGYRVVKLRPRTFTDTSTDDDEIRQKVNDRIRKRKNGAESNA